MFPDYPTIPLVVTIVMCLSFLWQHGVVKLSVPISVAVAIISGCLAWLMALVL
jgi:hypothetical protein